MDELGLFLVQIKNLGWEKDNIAKYVLKKERCIEAKLRRNLEGVRNGFNIYEKKEKEQSSNA